MKDVQLTDLQIEKIIEGLEEYSCFLEMNAEADNHFWRPNKADLEINNDLIKILKSYLPEKLENFSVDISKRWITTIRIGVQAKNKDHAESLAIEHGNTITPLIWSEHNGESHDNLEELDCGAIEISNCEQIPGTSYVCHCCNKVETRYQFKNGSTKWFIDLDQDGKLKYFCSDCHIQSETGIEVT
jgi:hypothetical protein